jgi:hypothetical protein
MTTRKYSSRSQQTTLTSALTSTATTANVVSGTTLLGGISISAGETYTVVIDPDTALEEIVDVTAVSTNTLTIVRGIETAGVGQAHSAGAVVRHMVTGRDLREANQHIENTTTAHGLTLANLVKTTDTSVVTGSMIVDGAVGTAKIDNAAVTEAKLGTSAVTTTKIADLNVTTGKLADSAVTVTSTMIADGTIVNADINSAAAIDKTKISGTAITAGDTGTVTSTMILDGTIVNGDINASAAIAATKIAGTAVTQADTGTVTSTMIANGTIVDADVSSTAAIAKSKLNLGGTITSADIVDGTIVASDIADGTITAAKLVSDPYARANHTGTQLASTISDFNTAVRTNTLNQMTAPTADVSMATYKVTNVGTPTLSTDAANKNYVDTQVSALVNGAPSTLDTLKEIADAISSGGTFYDAVVLKGGSTMTGALVLNADPTLNLGAATKQYVDAVAGSATAAAASAAAAATTYDNFDDRYLGPKATAPTLDNDGNALLTGALYWNTTSNTMFAWSGSAWGSISSTAAIFRYKFLPSAGATSVSGTDANGVTLAYLPGKEQVYLNGILLVRDTDYTASNGTSITSISAMAAGDVLEVITFTAFDLATAIDKTILDVKGDLIVASAADTPGKLAAGTNGYFLQADSTQALGLKWAAVDLSSYLTSATAASTYLTQANAASTYATQSSVTTLSNTHDADTMMFIMGAY